MGNPRLQRHERRRDNHVVAISLVNGIVVERDFKHCVLRKIDRASNDEFGARSEAGPLSRRVFG